MCCCLVDKLRIFKERGILPQLVFGLHPQHQLSCFQRASYHMGFVFVYCGIHLNINQGRYISCMQNFMCVCTCPLLLFVWRTVVNNSFCCCLWTSCVFFFALWESRGIFVCFCFFSLGTYTRLKICEANLPLLTSYLALSSDF